MSKQSPLPPISTNFRTSTVVPIIDQSSAPLIDRSQQLQACTTELQLDIDEQAQQIDTFDPNLKPLKTYAEHHHHHHQQQQQQYIEVYNDQGGTVILSPHSPSTTTQVNVREINELVELIGAKSYYKQAVIEFLYMLSQAYAVMVGALLVVFVPQQCCTDIYNTNTNTVLYTSENGRCNQNVISTAHECTIHEQVTDLSNFNVAALVFNFIALLSMIIYFTLIWERENYILKYFVEDPFKVCVYSNFYTVHTYVSCCILTYQYITMRCTIRVRLMYVHNGHNILN